MNNITVMMPGCLQTQTGKIRREGSRGGKSGCDVYFIWLKGLFKQMNTDRVLQSGSQNAVGRLFQKKKYEMGKRKT